MVIDNRLTFSEHISVISRAALTRAKLILKTFTSGNKELLIRAYITYVRPLLEYCSPVWSPHHQNLINKLEHVQRYFSKRIPGLWKTSYTDRLRILGLKTLEFRRVCSDLSLCYRIVYGLTDTSLSKFFRVKSDLRTRGHDLRIQLIPFKKDITKYLFINRTINIWNKLPAEVVHAASISAFKSKLLTINI